jgi:uncharacterized protein (TIGR02118 family)
MIKLVVMYPYPADPEHFKRHYTEQHLPMCRAIPGMNRIHYTFEPKTIGGPGRWFCLFEAEFADEAALNAALATPEAQRAGADVQNYSPDAPTSLVYKLVPV